MAVLRQELTRTTFQDKQIKLMTDISSDVRNLEKDVSKGFLELKGQVNTINSSIQGLYYSFVRYFETGTAAFISDIEDAMDDLREGIDEDSRDRDKNNEGEHQRQADKYQQYINNQNKTLTDNMQVIARGITRVLNIFGVSLDKVAQDANTLTDLVNTGVRNTGLSREALKGFRDDIMSTVSVMNERTNNLYSPIQSMELMIGMINQTGIKNLKFYEEYGELFLEAQKTTNINLSTLAEFSDTFYRKYNFSSSSMEELMKGIRTNTAGTSTSEEKLMQFMQGIDSQIYAYAYRMGGNTEQNYNRLSGNIESTYTWLREQGYDADYLFKLINGAATGGITSSEAKTLSMLGINPDSNQLISQLMSDPASLMVKLINAIGSKQFTKYGGNGSYLANMYGVDYNTAVLAEAKGLRRSSYDTFLSNRPEVSDEEDLWLSAEERTANKAEEMAVALEDIQEDLGIKATTLFEILGTIKDVIIGVYGAHVTTKLWDFLSKGFGGAGGGFGAFLKTGAIAAAIYFSAEAIIKSAHSADIADEYIRQLSELGGYGRVSVGKGGTASNTSSSSLKETQESGANAAQRVHDDTLNQDMGTLGNVSGAFNKWFMTDVLNWSEEKAEGKIVASRAPGREDAARRNVALWNTAYDAADGVGAFEGQSNDTMLRMLNAYEAKGYLNDPRIYNWLMGSDGSGSGVLYPTGITKVVPGYEQYGPQKVSMLQYALEMFEQGKLLLPKYGNGILGIGAGYNYNSGDFQMVNAYKKGTNYIPDDQLALLHEGEAVIPAEENPFNQYNSSINRQSYLKDIADNSKSIKSDNSDIVELLTKILAFMQYWKSNNEESDIVNSVLESARSMNLSLSIMSGDVGLVEDDATGYSSDGGVG